MCRSHADGYRRCPAHRSHRRASERAEQVLSEAQDTLGDAAQADPLPERDTSFSERDAAVVDGRYDADMTGTEKALAVRNRAERRSMRRMLAMLADVWGDICVALSERHDAASRNRRERQAMDWADRGHSLTEQMLDTAAAASEWAWITGRWGSRDEPLTKAQWDEVRARHLAMKRRWVETASEGKGEHAAVLDLHVRALEKILGDHAGQPLTARDIDSHRDQSEREAKRARGALTRHGDRGIDLARALIADATEQGDHTEGTRMPAERKASLARDLFREGSHQRSRESLQWLDPQYTWQIEWAVANARAERERFADVDPVPVG